MPHAFRFGLVLLCSLACTIAQADESSFDSHGVKIRYVTSGEGEPVILLHGFAVRSAEEMWVKNALNEPQILPELARKFRVIALDLRGHGKSDKPQGAENYGSEMVEDVVRLLDHLQIQRAHVVGYSLGAIIAGKLLVTHPDRLLSVTLGGGAPVYRPSKKWTAVTEALAESLERGAGAGPLLPAISPSGEAKSSPAAMAALGQLLVFGQDQKVLAAVIRSTADLEVTTEQLQTNTVPVLMIYGSREGEVQERIGKVQQSLARSQTKIVQGGDHFTTFARPEFRQAILKFLETKR